MHYTGLNFYTYKTSSNFVWFSETFYCGFFSSTHLGYNLLLKLFHLVAIVFINKGQYSTCTTLKSLHHLRFVPCLIFLSFFFCIDLISCLGYHSLSVYICIIFWPLFMSNISFCNLTCRRIVIFFFNKH